MNKGFYAGSFDPFTNGHLHIIEKSSQIFDKVVVGIGNNQQKLRRFDRERMKKAMEALIRNKKLTNVEVVTYDNLSVETAIANNCNLLIRGIRNGMDYAYEENLSQINEELSGLDTIYIRSGKFGIVSSSMVYDLILNKRDISRFVPAEIIDEFKLQGE